MGNMGFDPAPEPAFCSRSGFFAERGYVQPACTASQMPTSDDIRRDPETPKRIPARLVRRALPQTPPGSGRHGGEAYLDNGFDAGIRRTRFKG
jgi:hypothetical protein